MDKGMSIKAFLSHEDGHKEVRRFAIPSDYTTNFKFIKSKVQNIFGIDQDVSLSWQDEEGDMVTICSDEEMVEAIEECITQQQQKLFKIFVNLSCVPEKADALQRSESQLPSNEEPSSTLSDSHPNFNASEIQVESCITVKEEQYDPFQNGEMTQQKKHQPEYSEAFQEKYQSHLSSNFNGEACDEMEQDPYLDLRSKLARCLKGIDENQNSISSYTHHRETPDKATIHFKKGPNFFPEERHTKQEQSGSGDESDASPSVGEMDGLQSEDESKPLCEQECDLGEFQESECIYVGEESDAFETEPNIFQEPESDALYDNPENIQADGNILEPSPNDHEDRDSVSEDPPGAILNDSDSKTSLHEETMGAPIVALEEIPEDIQEEIQQLEAGFQGVLFVEEGLVSQVAKNIKVEKNDEDLVAAASYLLGEHPLMPTDEPVINQYETEIMAQIQPIINMACNERVIIRSNFCPECQMECIDKEEFVTHWTTHLDSKPYKCLECNYRSYQIKLIENHMYSHYKVKRYRCKLCSFRTSKSEQLEKHLLSHSDLKPFKCAQCEAEFAQKRGLTIHMFMHTGEKPFKCSECSAAYILKEHLKKHMLKHSGVKPFKCVWCSRQFAHKFSLKFHMYRHLKLKPYKCAECEMQFTQKGHLNSHMIIHSHVRPFKCTECGAGFNRKETMKRHVLSHSKIKEYKCSECPAEFALKGSLKRHSLSHKNPKKHICIICSIEFDGRDQLRTHMVIHQGKKPFRCEPCNAEFTQMGSLKRHLMRHGKRRTYTCPSCSMVFKQKGFYDKHLLTHQDPKRHVCTICNLEFKTKEYLRRHSVIHMETKPHKCPDCNAEFAHKWNLKRHTYVHTGIKPFKCMECDKAYIQKQQLKEHMLVHMRFDD